MTVLGFIRKRGEIIVIVIGVALLAFVIGDFIPGIGTRNFDIAKVAGQTLSWQQFEAKIDEVSNRFQQQLGGQLDDRMRDIVHDQAWQMLIDETVMQQTFERIGLTVSPEELWDVITGFNPPPIIRHEFSNPETGEFDRSWLMNFLRFKDTDPNAVAFWNMVERLILDDQLLQKYNTLIGRGIFVPDFMAENENHEINRQFNFDFIVQSYFSIHDSLINVSNNDLRDFYRRNQNRWEQTASRDIEFVVFNVVPSEDDHAAAQAWIERIKPEFQEAEDPFQFIRLNTRAFADTRFFTREQLPLQAAELFDEPVGSMAGPFQEGESWRLIRLVNSENRPDSVNLRQIVIVPREQTQASYTEALALADSIKTAIERGADFARLAVQHSADPAVATNNGDLGWVHEAMVQGSIMEPIFDMRRGEVSIIETGQGVILVAQVAERGREVRKVQIATLQHDILPSTRTDQIIYSQASRFAIENRNERQFDETVAAQNLTRRMANNIGENDRQLPGLFSARPIIRWAFDARQGEVSDVFALDNMYVVAILKNIRRSGVAPINDVIAEIDFEVRREKRGELIASQFLDATRNAQSFSELALNLNLPVESALGVTFSSFSVPGAGIEPHLIGAVTGTDEGVISNPVKGINGVFLFMVTQVTEPEEIGVEIARERLRITLFNRSMSEPLQALRNAAKIEDMRSKFY